jgi:hypothetical protein
MLTVATLTVSTASADAQSSPTPNDTAYLHNLKHQFHDGSITAGPKRVDCKLSGGTETTCFSITVKTVPSGFSPGPWCPRHIADGPDKAGIWLDGGKVYDADGAFIEKLGAFYNDDSWQLFDPKTGAVNVTDTKESCEAAARPDVDPKYRNYCVECQTSYLKEGSTMTYIIPVDPVRMSRPARIGFSGVGLAFSGVRLDAPAPTHAILGAHTLAPFDDCGGHVNLHVGYHIHAVTDCLKEVGSAQGHAPIIGIAMDGIPLYSRLNSDRKEPQDLDSCRGHAFGDLGYHYHVAAPGKNQILPCHVAETGCATPDASQYCDATRRLHRP